MGFYLKYKFPPSFYYKFNILTPYMYKRYSDIDKGKFLQLYEQGKSGKEISATLNIPTSTVSNWIKKFKKVGCLKRKHGSGRKSSLFPSDHRFIMSEKNKNKQISAPSLQCKLKKEKGTCVSTQTIRNALMYYKFKASIPAKVPILTKKHMTLRKEICTKWSYEADDYWDDVVFSDEVSFNLVNSDGKHWVWRPEGERLNPDYTSKVAKHGGGKVMLWGCFSKKGVGELVMIEGIMDKYKYVEVLSNNLRKSATKLGMSSFKFQQDND